MLTSDSVKCANNRQQRQTWEKIHMTKIFYPYSKTVAKEMICSEKKKKKPLQCITCKTHIYCMRGKKYKYSKCI